MTYTVLSNEEQDPYPNYKIEIQNETNHMLSDFENWNDMLHTTNTAQNPEFKSLTETLKRRYKTINRSLKELQKSIINIEQNENKFMNISESELNERKKFLREMQLTINDCRNGMQGSKSVIEQHKKETYLSTNASVSLSEETPLDRASRVMNNEFIANQKKQVQIERKDQSEVMEDMLFTLKRLGAHGTQIIMHMDEQKEVLEEIDEEMDTVQDRIDRLTRKLDQLMGHSQTKKIILIVVLIVILAVMIYFMF